MEIPCSEVSLNTWPVWAIVGMAVLSHARGTVLLVREVGLVWGSFRRRRLDRKRRRMRDQ